MYGGAVAAVYLLYSGISGTCHVVCTAAAQRSVAWHGGSAGAFFHSLCGNVTRILRKSYDFAENVKIFLGFL